MITLGAVVQGRTSLAYKTGSWRSQRPQIDPEACKYCGICQQVCPDAAVIQEADAFRIDYDYCKGCGICAHECPVQAISMLLEEK